MRMALSLAARGAGTTSPNPMVGCVIVRDGHVIATGWHRAPGAPHAEAAALAAAGERAEGATVYVNLEPCAHQGRTPPCAPALVSAKVVRVVAGLVDPFPQVAGKGIGILREAGIEVDCPVLAEESAWLNRGFLSAVKRKRPWVTLKIASSLDGITALPDGTSQWITGPTARKLGHLLRSENDAVMVGGTTARRDKPRLDVRDVGGSSPRPVVVSRDFSAAMLLPRSGDALAYAADGCPIPDKLKGRAATVPTGPGGLDLSAVLADLCRRGVNRLLVEGGGTLASSLLQEGLVDQLSVFQAPCVLGKGTGMAQELLTESLLARWNFVRTAERRVDDDLWIEGVSPCSQDWLSALAGSSV